MKINKNMFGKYEIENGCIDSLALKLKEDPVHVAEVLESAGAELMFDDYSELSSADEEKRERWFNKFPLSWAYAEFDSKKGAERAIDLLSVRA